MCPLPEIETERGNAIGSNYVKREELEGFPPKKNQVTVHRRKGNGYWMAKA